jgi:hypothetical protein
MHSWILWTLLSLGTSLDAIESNARALCRPSDQVRVQTEGKDGSPPGPGFAVTESLQYVRFEQSIERLQDWYHLGIRTQISLGSCNQIFDEGLKVKVSTVTSIHRKLVRVRNKTFSDVALLTKTVVSVRCSPHR